LKSSRQISRVVAMLLSLAMLAICLLVMDNAELNPHEFGSTTDAMAI